jgi:ferredoxin
MSELFVTERNSSAREIAYAAVAKLKPESTSLVEYRSRGHVIIIANSEALIANDELENFNDLSTRLSSEIIQFEGQSSPLTDANIITIKGALGQFVVGLEDKEFKADLILDLSPKPILDMAYKPPGYLSTGTERVNIHKKITELEDLIGTFEKPLYIHYDENICAHGRSGKPGCTRCIDACPAEAITSLVNKIAVDPFRCQGGGICTTVCPSSAISYTYPKPKDLLNHVRTLVLSYIEALQTDQDSQSSKKGGGTSTQLSRTAIAKDSVDKGYSADLVFVTEDEKTRVEQLLPAALIITVEEVASVGPEIWLSALAWGARSVRLFALDGIPEIAQKALDLHIEIVQSTLVAMGHSANVVSVITDPSELITVTYLSKIVTATHAALTEKRQAFFMALDYLYKQTLHKQNNTTAQVVSLPTGAIFGSVAINTSSCTLCMACVSACPGNALQDGHEKPQVSLVEDKCLQCGICVSTCPENAMSMSPRLLLDRQSRLKPQVLHEDAPFCCTACGKPFATTSGIKTILAKLSGHSMFADQRAKDRLKMCDDCRVVDMMEDPAVDF